MKPPFRLPTMADVKDAAGTNGYKMVGTFSGCGGSTTGYKLAGFDVVYAAEFDNDSVASYRLNYPDANLWTEDICALTGPRILEETGLKVGELDLLEGSPPCSKFSMSGVRQRTWGKVTASDSEREQANVEDLFFEYLRLVGDLMPRAVCAENVPGLKATVAAGYFKRIVEGLEALGYRVAVYQVNALWCGVPQSRRRVFFTGIRDDLPVEKIQAPEPLPYKYTMLDALPYLGKAAMVHYDFGVRNIKQPVTCAKQPMFCLTRTGGGGAHKAHIVLCDAEIDDDTHFQPPGTPDPVNRNGKLTSFDGRVTMARHPRRFSIPEIKTLASFPPDFALEGTWASQWERIGNAVPPLMAQAVASRIREALDACR